MRPLPPSLFSLILLLLLALTTYPATATTTTTTPPPSQCTSMRTHTTTTAYTSTSNGTVIVGTMLQPIHEVVVIEQAAGTVTEYASAARTMTSTVALGSSIKEKGEREEASRRQEVDREL